MGTNDTFTDDSVSWTTVSPVTVPGERGGGRGKGRGRQGEGSERVEGVSGGKMEREGKRGEEGEGVGEWRGKRGETTECYHKFTTK